MSSRLPEPFYIIVFYFIPFFSTHVFLHSTNMYEFQDAPNMCEVQGIELHPGGAQATEVLKSMAL